MGSVAVSWLIIGLCPFVFGDQLMQVHLLFRHGDRTPIWGFKDDPNVDKWSLPPGTLTPLGMEQQFLQGQRLKRRYVDQLKFINGSYDPTEMYVRSADSPRCIQSAGANLGAFYSGSIVRPNTQGWPTNWMPFPIHTYPAAKDTLCEEGSSSCKRIGLLESRRVKQTAYVQYLVKNSDFLNQLSRWSGGTVNDAGSIAKVWDTLYCQKAHNMTLPAWVTDDVWSRLNELYVYTDDFKDGAAVPAISTSENKELLALRSGELLGQFMTGISDVVNNRAHWKFNVYSAHDSTIKALLKIYHNQLGVLGVNNPDYASHLVLELWKDTKGNFYIQVLYSDNAYTEFRTVTSTLDACTKFPDGCPWSTFYQGYHSYVHSNFWTECEQTN